MIYMYMYMLLLNSSFMFFIFFYFIYYKMSLLFQWKIFSISSMSLNFIVYIDWISSIFISLVSMISLFVIFYSLSYMKDDKSLNRFIYLILLFIFSMYLMILSPSIMSILIGWDGLGLISYCLVIYYQSWKSYNSGMVTFMVNRIGDVGILMMISILMFKGSWNLFFYDFNHNLLMILMMISSFTKSAQMPFSVWLPLAMAAPTPVSSLVHSSTLVTAGVYMLIRYNYFIFMEMNKYMLIISSFTMLMSGIMANFENDLKKIIAFSTLSQLSLMMGILSLGEIELGFFHLVMHALFKSLLFMSAGMIIHLMFNNQDIRFMGSLIKIYPFISMVFFFSSLSLCGFPFFSGFYSKDMIMEFFLMSKMNLFILMIFLISTILTVSYSVRLIVMVFLNSLNKKNSVIMKGEDNQMSMSMIILLMLSIFGGYNLLNYFFYIEKIVILKFLEKFLVMIIMFLGIIMGFFLSKYNFIKMNNKMKIYLSMMFGLEFLFSKLYFYPNKFSMYMYKNFDKGFIEYFWVNGIKNKLFLKIMNFWILKNYFISNQLMYFILLLFFMFIIYM